MLLRSSFVFLVCLEVIIAFTCGKPLISSAKPVVAPKSQPGQSFVINNNCGLANVDREMIAHIKAKVDYIAGKPSKDSPCSTGWVAYGKSCYLIIDIPTLEWNDARRNCQKLGGDLAKITSAAENQFIYNLILKQAKSTAYGAWLGLHRKADTKFYWADDTPLTGYTAWSPGEPNSPSSEKCGHIFGPSEPRKGKWNDIECTLNKSGVPVAPVVLCQKNSN